MTTFTAYGTETFIAGDAVSFINTIRKIAMGIHPNISARADRIFSYEYFISSYVEAGGIDNAKVIYAKVKKNQEAIGDMTNCPEAVIGKYAKILQTAIEVQSNR